MLRPFERRGLSTEVIQISKVFLSSHATIQLEKVTSIGNWVEKPNQILYATKYGKGK